ncbi:HAMP domain-containing sensor histidine kinase [Stigmatella sp. ncwal1]|uniref:histidine kinase n=1 Tax=Stigmatella ashevillensis TaxID=2995309 RepID=A0ABT5D7K3_9BACT|nr:HAMP domain-containing sensor histidine kinase [Stigmatella ashevillena]MDC0708828.1 HAMP domain-containing sensor histidine kinase [Stigmatella ashevillena]
MRLAQRLFISHFLLTAVLLGAAGFAGVALVRITALLTSVREEQFGTLQEEEALHQASWEVEVAARQGILACEQGPSAGQNVADAMRSNLVELDRLLAEHHTAASPSLVQAAKDYREYAHQVAQGDACALLLSPELREQRLVFDLRLTEAWISSIHSLHQAVKEREAEAYAIGATAIVVGGVLGGFALLAAWGVARWVARGVTQPLALLTAQAHQVGQGDFTPLRPVKGPDEVQTLSTELERMRERLGELGRLKDAFVASVSHDLRTPLTRLRAALGLMADGTAGPLTEQQQRMLALASSACEREIRLVTALLDMSRLKSGKALRCESGCRLDDILHRALENVQAEAEEAGVQLKLDAEGSTPPATLDPVLIERSLTNLLSNAIRASSEGQRVHVVRTLSEQGAPERSGPGPWAQIIVRDEGPGVPSEVRSRLFEPFFTRPVGTRGAPPGIGLGLPLAREMMRAHGGDVALLDEPAPGATFALWVALDRSGVSPSPSPQGEPLPWSPP